MLASTLTQEQRLIKNLASEFAEKEIRPVASEIDRKLRFSSGNRGKTVRSGLYGAFRSGVLWRKRP